MTAHEWTYLEPVPGLAIGGLRSYASEVHQHFDVVLNCAFELAPKVYRLGAFGCALDAEGVHHVRLDDNDNPGAQIREIYAGVRLLNANLGERRCLVTCAEGRNRSALVIAETLVQARGADPRAVVDFLRTVRAGALTNSAFVAWLLRVRS